VLIILLSILGLYVFIYQQLSPMDRRRPEAEDDNFISNILKPGSSLHPTFLLIVDAAFLCLLLVLVTLVFLTAQNPHIFALIFIELCLWASVKWYRTVRAPSFHI
jgi:NADH:ubiquinone oxidoreductase subunit 6 (subunit J)